MAVTQYYVSPASGNDTTGDGTIGTPWATVQKALNTITRNATDGDQINLQAGGTDTLGAALTLATYGTPTGTTPLIIRGYTSAADDGGIGVISGAGSYAILSGNNDYLHLIDLRLTNVGANVAVSLRNLCSLQGCQIDTGTSRGVDLSGPCLMDRCYVYGFSSFGIYNTSNAEIRNTHIHTCGTYLIALSGPNGFVENCVCKPATAVTAIFLNSHGTKALNNTIRGSSGTGKGISAAASLTNLVVTGNVIAGFSGSGGIGISIPATCVMSQYHSNAGYNNTTNFSVAAKLLGVTGNNDALAADPFVNAASDDFDINGAQTGVTEDGWPSSFHTLSNTTPKPDKGAVQAGAGAASSGGVHMPRVRIGH